MNETEMKKRRLPTARLAGRSAHPSGRPPRQPTSLLVVPFVSNRFPKKENYLVDSFLFFELYLYNLTNSFFMELLNKKLLCNFF
jgi:hypothetical protein